MLDSSMDTMIDDMDITMNQYRAHKIVYISKFKTLIDKVLKVWLIVNGVAYEISYEAPNTVLCDSYYSDAFGIMNSFKITK